MSEQLTKICLGGGLFAILTFIHFFTDFICQSHFEAMNKHNNPWIRARHCLIYVIGFLPILIYFNYNNILSNVELTLCVNILFWSHFFEDTYFPVYLWAKHIRRPPEMVENRRVPLSGITIAGQEKYITLPPNPQEGFKEFISTTLGKILMISVDQIIHLAFLFPVVYMCLN